MYYGQYIEFANKKHQKKQGMGEIKKEFTDFIRELVSSYPKITPTRSNLSLISKQSREFNEKVQRKIDDLIFKNPKLEALAIKLALAPIRAVHRI